MNFEDKRKKEKTCGLDSLDERTILQHFRRVSGAFKYKLNWLKLNSLVIFTVRVWWGDEKSLPYYTKWRSPTKQRPLPPKNDPPQKRSKLNTKSKEQIEILEKEFWNCSYLNDKSLQDLINVTGLKYKTGFLKNRGEIPAIKNTCWLLKFYVFCKLPFVYNGYIFCGFYWLI